jgi:hypothetical protein
MELHPDRRAAGTVTSRPVKRTCYFLAIPNEYVEKVVRPRRQADRDVKGAEADERQKLQAELDQLAEKLSKPEYAEDEGAD